MRMRNIHPPVRALYRFSRVGAKFADDSRADRRPARIAGGLVTARRGGWRADQGQRGMPETVRANVGILSRPRRMNVGAATALMTATLATPAAAEEAGESASEAAFLHAVLALDRYEIVTLVLTLGVIFFATVTAIMLVRTRARAERTNTQARAEIMALKAEVDSARALLLSEPQIIAVWSASGEQPEILGDTSIVTAAPVPRRALAFGTWLPPDKARAIEAAIAALQARGEGFAMALTTLSGRHIEAEGRAVGNRAVLRLKDMSG